MSSFDLPMGVVRRNARARGLVVRRGRLESAVSSLVAGRHLLMMASLFSDGAAVAEMLADTAADCGFCFGSLTLSTAAGRLLTAPDIIAERFHDDVWLIARGADEQGLGRIDDFIHTKRLESRWRAIVVTELLYADVIGALSQPGRRRFAFIEL
jgi:hypothetical protein